ncbi:MAG TPA: class I SAM-dependent methyltransferase [Steroidobacter sp.]|nr:class I SAM-dependent methyltransferase [Steroidobacter sp.]
MLKRRLFIRSVVQMGALLAWVLAAGAVYSDAREDCERDFKPQTGQSGKDVIWVPTSDALVMRMLTMAGVRPTDLVYDLGAGDGKIAIAAAKHFGARAVGVEYNAEMARLGQCLAKADGVSDRVRIVQGDIFETDFSDATVITLYLLPELNMRLRPTILRMKPGTRVVSHSFLMDDWEPDERSTTEDGQAYLWIVPAKVDGAWTFRREGNRKDRFTVRLQQAFQEISGSAGNDQLMDAKLNGSEIAFSFPEKGGATRVEGRANGDRIEARVTRGGKTANFVGRRT